VAHNPEVLGSNPSPATVLPQVSGHSSRVHRLPILKREEAQEGLGTVPADRPGDLRLGEVRHEAALAADTDAIDALLDEMHAISELRKARVLPRNQD
jgi:hypothetical protein